MSNFVAGNLVWKVTGDTSGFDKSITASKTALKEFQDLAAKTGANLTKFVSLPLLGLGAAAIKTAANIETQKIAFGKLLKDVDKGAKLFEDLKRFSAETPLQLDDITKGAQKLLAFGVAAEDVEGKLRRLGDVALGNSETLDRLTNAYGKLKAKGKATLEELNMFATSWLENPLMLKLNTEGLNL
jgi:phage tail tape-measure protein